MPQASDEQRALMKRWFGDPIDDRPPTEFLLAHGYVVDQVGLWRKPTSAHRVSYAEGACLDFLCDEWDHAFVDMGFWPGAGDGDDRSRVSTARDSERLRVRRRDCW